MQPEDALFGFIKQARPWIGLGRIEIARYWSLIDLTPLPEIVGANTSHRDVSSTEVDAADVEFASFNSEQ